MLGPAPGWWQWTGRAEGGSHLGPEVSFVVLGLVVCVGVCVWGGLVPTLGGQDAPGREREGWKPIEAHLKCQGKFIAKAGSCWHAGAPLPLAAPPLLMHIHAYS